MMRLWDEGPQRQVDLVRALESDAPTVARTVRRLDKAGFVRRAPSTVDGRVTIVEATQASMPLKRTVERIWAELEALTVAALSEAERANVLSALEQLESNLVAAEPKVMS